MKEHRKVNEAHARQAFENALATHRQDFGEFFLARLFGLQFEYPGDACRVSFELRDYMFNPQGSLHGGIIAFVLDISMGHLLNRTLGAGTTLEMKVQYIKAAREGRLTATGRFLRQGRGISYLRAEMTDESGDLVAFATSTWKLLRSRD
jgi:uncharacterized protein (TIGR00369 family)